MNHLKDEHYQLVFDLYTEDVRQKQEMYEYQQWLAYFTGWVSTPGKKADLMSFEEFRALAEEQRRTSKTTWEEAEQAGNNAYSALRRKHGGKAI